MRPVGTYSRQSQLLMLLVTLLLGRLLLRLLLLALVGLLLAVLYFCTAMLFQKFIHHPLPAMTRAALPLGPFLSIGFAALYCFGG